MLINIHEGYREPLLFANIDSPEKKNECHHLKHRAGKIQTNTLIRLDKFMIIEKFAYLESTVNTTGLVYGWRILDTSHYVHK